MHLLLCQFHEKDLPDTKEPWGEFIDVKINAAELLEKENTQEKMGEVWVSGVCDPYQPLEAQYCLTRKCLAILGAAQVAGNNSTRSPLVLRDIDIIKNSAYFRSRVFGDYG